MDTLSQEFSISMGKELWSLVQKQMNIRRKGTAVIFLRRINMLDSGHLWVDMHPKAQFTGIGRSPPGCYWGRHSHWCWGVPMVATHRVPQPRGTWPGELGSDWDLFIAWVGGRRQEASAAPAVEWPIPGPLAGVLLPAARISGSGGPCLVLGVQERREDEVGVEQAPPQTPVGEAAVPLPAHLWRRGMLWWPLQPRSAAGPRAHCVCQGLRVLAPVEFTVVRERVSWRTPHPGMRKCRREDDVTGAVP